MTTLINNIEYMFGILCTWIFSLVVRQFSDSQLQKMMKHLWKLHGKIVAFDLYNRFNVVNENLYKKFTLNYRTIMIFIFMLRVGTKRQ